jgi:hypothetical protein
MNNLKLIHAAKKKLQENTHIDPVVDDKRIAFRIRKEKGFGVIDYYVPRIFHLCSTLEQGVYMDIAQCDLIETKYVSEIYKNEGVGMDKENVRMLNNWPIKNIKVVGRVVNILKNVSSWILHVDDGSFERGSLEIKIDKRVWIMMEVENSCVGLKIGWTVAVYGSISRIRYDENYVAIQADRIYMVGRKGEGLQQQLEWWKSVIEVREVMKSPWVLDMQSQNAMEALHSLQKQEEDLDSFKDSCESSSQSQPQPQIDVITIDDEEREMKVMVNNRLVSAQEYSTRKWSRAPDFSMGTPSLLEMTIMREFVNLTASYKPTENSFDGLTMEVSDLYKKYSVTTVLNTMVLGIFVENAAGLADDSAVYDQWRSLHFQESKQMLLFSTLKRLEQQQAITLDVSKLIIGLTPFQAAVQRVVKLFHGMASLRESEVKLGRVARALWRGVSRAASIGIVGELITRGAVDHEWVFESSKDRWTWILLQ